MQRALISGITGHLGRTLGAQLIASGVEVHGLTRRQADDRAPMPERVHLHRVDGQTETLGALLEQIRPDIVFHLAALMRGEHRAADVTPFVHANILLGTQLLEAMRSAGCRRIITAGTYLQHADSEEYRAFNLYAATKQAFESMLEYYADAFDFCAVRLTVCNIYSEDEGRPSLTSDIAEACRRASALVVRSPEVRIDLVHVEDVARAFAQMALRMEGADAPRGRLSRFSVTSGADLSPDELIRLFEKLGNTKVSVQSQKVVPGSRRVRPWRGQVVPDWAPRISIEEGISRILSRAPN